MSEQNFDYFYELCVSHANLKNQLETYIKLTNEGNKNFGQVLEKFYFQGNKGKENLRKFNLLIKWHRMLAGKPDTSASQLEELESNLGHLFDHLHTIDEHKAIENQPAKMPAATIATLNKATEKVVDHPFDPIKPAEATPSIAAPSPSNQAVVSPLPEPTAPIPPVAPIETVTTPVVNPVEVSTPPPAPAPLPPLEIKTENQGAQPQGSPTVTMDELLAVFNEVIGSAHRYLGKSIALGHIQSSRPEEEWLEHFELKTPKQLIFHGEEADLTREQLQIFEAWVQNFVKDCSAIISDFPNMINYQEITQIFK